jgi:rhodanese-related sulfurtransferase
MGKLLTGSTIILVAFLVNPVAAMADNGTQVKIAEGTYRSISPAELSEMLASKDFFLVNVHVPYTAEIPGTDALISYLDADARIGDYPLDKELKIVVYCMTNRMSGIAVRRLLKEGFKNVYMLDGGMTAWKAAGFKLVNRSKATTTAPYPSESEKPVTKLPQPCGCDR